MGKKPRVVSTVDPQFKNLLTQNVNRAQNVADQPFKPFSGPLAPNVAPQVLPATQAAQSVATYTPQQVTAPTIGGGQNVKSQTAASQMGQYLNPYTDQVVNAALSDINRQNDIANVGNSQAATLSGAWNGSRHGVAEAETNRAYGDIAARTAAQLRMGGFDTAAGLGAADASRALAAAQGNQQNATTRGIAGAQLGLQGQIANQNAGLAGGQLNLGAANTLGNLGSLQFGMEDTGLQRAYQEYLRQYQDPFQKQQLLNQTLGLLPAQSQQQVQGPSGGILQGVGSIVGGVAAFF